MIRNTVPTLFRYIGNGNDKTITKRQNDKSVHACQGTRRYQVQHQHHIACQEPRALGVHQGVRAYGQHVHHVSGVYRVVWLYGEHVSVALCGIQFVL